MTHWPNKEKSLPVSKTMSPVTQVADVAVNRASNQEISRPSTEAIGKFSKKAPIIMINKKPATKI